MKKTNDERLLDSMDYIDEKFIAGAEKYYTRRPASNIVVEKFAKRNRILKIAVAVAACLVLVATMVPAANVIIEHYQHIPPVVGAENSSFQVENSPEYDGSRGLQYVINEDGQSATFIGYGSCTDEIVYIASTYEGLPVTEMYNKGYWDAEDVPHYHDFNSKYVKKLVISDTVVKVDFECIRQCPNIESVYYGASVNNIRHLPFNSGYGENFAKVEVSPKNPHYSDKGNCIVDLRSKTLVVATPTTVIPDDGSVEIIGFMAFKSADSITSITIPEGVKIIEHKAFSACMDLESVTLPDSLKVIERGAFDFCENLKTLEFGTNLIAVDKTLFHPHYVPKISYKGTVAQWEAVIKTDTGTDIDPVAINCTDGVSRSDAGKQGVYNWIFLPEFEAVWNTKYPDRPQPDIDPEYGGSETKQ